tara:strand:- start:14014 stop:17304 length:3291 start_codon:yes stop_codon:yes gene_type:complete
MAEIRNTFVKSKMNKDLDDRLLSKGEYRNAENVQISRSEGEDVGALENILGNNIITNWGLDGVPNLEIIGYTTDEAKDRAFFTATNYTDVSDNELDHPAPYGASCYILMFDNQAVDPVDKYKILVQGRFLNFSKTHPIYGIDLIEDLLFWTDNRNQPRKINTTKAIASSTHYTTEEQISVAKYYPYVAPHLYSTVTVDIISGTGIGPYVVSASDIAKLDTGMLFKYTNIVQRPSSDEEFNCYINTINDAAAEFTIDRTLASGNLSGSVTFIYPSCQDASDVWLPPSCTGIYEQTSAGINVVVVNINGQVPEVGMRVTCPGIVEGSNSTTGQFLVTNVSYTPGNATVIVQLNQTLPAELVAGENNLIQFSSLNGYYKNNWPGDAEYLREKFVRFAYRFKFEDGEYSVISPFTQPAFIPKQDGYFFDSPSRENQTIYLPQEESAGASTIVKFFENKVNNIFLNIETPYAVNQLASKLNVTEIDILYKESNGLAIQVIETIPVTDASITGNSTSLYTYNYQSRKPFRTLPEKETTRVFDKVPVRALSQSVVGNRVVYGNFIDKHTPPENLDYNINVSEKFSTSPISAASTVRNYSRVSYPNHTLKQNRTYQVGIVLSDKYGRQSDVVLSSLDASQYTLDGSTFNGSTVYSPYKEFSDPVLSKWFGNSLKVLFRDSIPSTQTGEYAEGYPGLYKSGTYNETTSATTFATLSYFTFTVAVNENIEVGDIITGLDAGGNPFIRSVNEINVARTIVYFNNDLDFDASNPQLVFHGEENKLGWYTYKVVVKQTEQEYYNVYLPNINTTGPLAALNNSAGSTNQYLTSESYYTPLISDNINKISSDLQEVQPEQTQFRTSDDILFPRVGFNPDVSDNGTLEENYSANFFVGREFIQVNNIAKIKDLGIQSVNADGIDVGKIDAANGGGTTAGTAVYDRPIIGGSGVGAKARVIVSTSGVNNFAWVVITDGGYGYLPSDGACTIGNWVGSNPEYIAGQSQWTGNIDITIDASVLTTERGTDLTPLTSQGLYNATSNPPVAQLSSNGKFIIGGEYNKNYVFSTLEVKPLNSRLEVFWETSTSGLVSELNSSIGGGGSATPVTPIERS